MDGNKQTGDTDNIMMNKKRQRDNYNESNIQTNTKKKIISGRDCPYLGTIKRHLLDFDFEKVCSISLTNLNVYACLICGKYFQGRGISTHAYAHSLEQDHHMFINLNDQKIYSLPDGFEVIDNSLNDIKFNLKPSFSKPDIAKLDAEVLLSKALDATEYIPGCIGLNNIKRTDYVNVIIQALCRVSTLRNFFLEYEDKTTDLVRISVNLLLNRNLIQRDCSFKGGLSCSGKFGIRRTSKDM